MLSVLFQTTEQQKKKTALTAEQERAQKLFNTKRLTVEDSTPKNETEIDQSTNTPISCNTLLTIYQQLTKIEEKKGEKPERLTAARQAKLAITIAFCSYLEKKEREKRKISDKKATKPEQAPNTSSCKVISYLPIVVFSLNIFGSLVMAAMGAFFGGFQMFTALIPTLSRTAAFILAGNVALVECILFLSFEAMFLRSIYGINSEELSDVHIRDHNTAFVKTEKINAKLKYYWQNTETAKLEHAETVIGLAAEINKSTAKKKELYTGEYEESPWNKFSRYTVTLLGSGLQVIGAYFMVNNLLQAAATTFKIASIAAIPGTPLGWILVGIAVVIMLTNFLSMRGKGIVNMMNPGLKTFEELKEKLPAFLPESAENLGYSYRLQQKVDEHEGTGDTTQYTKPDTSSSNFSLRRSQSYPVLR